MLPASYDSLVPGVSFGSYVVREHIGRGGMASVYRAEHLLLEKAVALKVMDRSLLATAGARQRFVLEGRAAAAIKHPNVVDITDVGVHDDVPFLVMELLTGEDLDAHLRRHGPLDEAATVRLALPLIAALSAAHSRGVVHRDIKPSNIFLSQGADGQIAPKLLDFGISKVMNESSNPELALTPHHQVMGTPRYLPPEALHGARELGPASDQFSLGVVLYECVTGSTPFSGDTLIALLNALSAGGFRPPRTLAPGISSGLDRAIMRALSPQPSERFTSIRDMGRALLELAAERTQMVWGHSFKVPGEEPGSSVKAARSAPTELIDRLDRPGFQRYRGVLVASALVAAGAIASAVGSLLIGSSRGPAVDAAERARQSVRQEAATLSVATLPVPVDPPVRPDPPAEKAAGSAVPPATVSPAAVSPAAVSTATGHARPARGPARRSGQSRRNDRAAEPRRADRRAEASSAVAVPPSESSEPSRPAAAPPPEAAAAPAPATAPETSASVPSSAEGGAKRRRGANQSPLLD